MSARAPDSVRHGSPLRRREFRLYFVGNLVSNVGSWLSNVAVGVYMLELTGSSFWVGVAGFGLFIPTMIFALPAGVLADRMDRLRLLRRAQVWMALLAILLAVLVGVGQADRYSITLIAFGLGLGIALAIPTMQALIPLLVPPEEMPDAIRLNALTFNIARVVGPVTAAATYVTLGPTWAFGLNAVSFFPLVAALTLIKRAPFPRAADRPPGPLREGIAYAWRHLQTRWMLAAIVAIGFSLDPIITLSPALARRFGLAAGGAGWIVAAWGSGAVLMILAGRRGIRLATEHGLGWIGLVALSAGVAGLGLSPSLVPALACGVLAGAGFITATMAFTTSIQRDVPESLRGRVSALWTLAFLGPRALASVAVGSLADAVGPRAATIAFSSVALFAAVFLRRVEGLKEELSEFTT